MPVKKAVGFFIGSDGNARVNCGQAVAMAFKEKFNLSDELVDEFVSSGFGKAPDGVCGALYAAQTILRQTGNDKTGEISKVFSEHAGSVYCSDIRKLRKVSCVGCVKKAASILDQEIGNKNI
ncbi:MAG: C-GCAxxG-C-C family (seleno)protein [Candidatus Omnitrophota bacterium]|jgi:hypothetical protein